MSSARKLAITGVTAALALGLVGCAGGSVDGSAAAPAADITEGGLTPISIGVFTSPSVAVIQAGEDQGFFEDHGFDVEIIQAASSAAQLPALDSGKIQFMLASPVSPILANTQGLDVQIIAGYAQNDPATVNDSTALVVGAGSAATSPRDLEGKTVSINALGSIGEIGINAAVEADGGDPSRITYIQLALGDVPAALESGQIDAGMTGAPWIGQVEAAGGSVLSDFIQEDGLGRNELVIAGNGTFAKEHADQTAEFVAALEETYEYANANHDALAALLPSILNIPEKAAQAQVWTTYSSELDPAVLDTFAELMTRYEIVSTEPDMDAVIWKH
ncbi:ABC transporter substrate-binding protein [Agromyces sp. H66]|uniref:ABC transporter substrate-binding protein n=1 Tax=Agromyces sp. H66 TaxID=2529859 RepID=UPI0010A9E57D|nr:ABC transporter substrate-binding protein [Agromyces sp. H66]